MRGSFIVNGTLREWVFPEDMRLLDLLRREGYTEVKCGCREGMCGSCCVLLEGKIVNSCQILAATVMHRDIRTVEALSESEEPHPLVTAFVEAGAVQCGFCTPGMILAAYCLLKENPDPSEEEIKRALDGNYCRCTGYVKIFEAVQRGARKMREKEVRE